MTSRWNQPTTRAPQDTSSAIRPTTAGRIGGAITERRPPTTASRWGPVDDRSDRGHLLGDPPEDGGEDRRRHQDAPAAHDSLSSGPSRSPRASSAPLILRLPASWTSVSSRASVPVPATRAPSPPSRPG